MRRVLCTLVSFLAVVPALLAEELRYTVLIAGNKSGQEVVTIGADGERRFAFEYNDRGRGPKLEGRIRLGADGTVVALESRGHDYMKAAVDESFSRQGDRVRWKNRGENGEREVRGRAQYVSFHGPMHEMGVLAQALLAAPEGRLALLPEGEARIDRVGELVLRPGEGSRTVVHYAISGLDFSPFAVWLDSAGKFFGIASAWFTVLPEGWEDSAAALIAAQDEADAKRRAELVRATTRRLESALTFRNVAVFDAEAAVLRPCMDVAVGKDGIIQSVHPCSSSAPVAGETIDGAGKTLLPGLWDMHTHVGANDGPLHIAAGVTSVRDLANDIETLAKLRKSWDEGSAVGPRVVAAGFLDGPGPFQGPTKILAATTEEGVAAIRRYHELGYRQVKLYSSLKPELVAPLAAEAHRLGMRVSGHIPAFMTAEQAIRDGYDEIQHINMLFLNFWADAVPDTRTPARFTSVAERAAGLDLDSPAVRSFLDLLKERDIVVDPTVGIFEGLFTDRPGEVSRSFAAIADRLPPTVRRGLLGGGLPVPDGMDQRYRDSFQALLRMIKRLDDRGIRIVAGTDNFAGFALHRELELYVEAGLAPAKVLQIATLGAARVAGKEAELGTIAAGKRADLVLVEGDPVATIADIRRTALVVKDGVVYSPAALYAALGVKP